MQKFYWFESLLADDDEVGLLLLGQLGQDLADVDRLQRVAALHVHAAVGAHGQGRPQRLHALRRAARRHHDLGRNFFLLQCGRKFVVSIHLNGTGRNEKECNICLILIFALRNR